MTSPATADASALDRYFRISERGSTVGREIRGGLVTFFTMAYIVVLNPIILGFATDIDGNFLGADSGGGPNLPAIAAGTALVAGVLTILMGVVANYPLALATGLGLNAFVAFAIASQMTWADAMGLVVIEGVLILVLVLTGFRTAVFHAIPAGAQDRDLGRHRPVHRPDRVRRRRVRAADPRRGRHDGPGPARPDRPAQRLAGAGVRLRPAPRHRAVGAQGARRDPDLDHHDHDRGAGRRGDRRPRAPRTTPLAGGRSTCRSSPTTGSPRPTSGRSASSRCSARSRRPGS